MPVSTPLEVVELPRPRSAADWRARLRAQRASLREEWSANADPARYLRQHRQLIDRLLRDLWRDLLPGDAGCLVAVGGYGRGELFPHSDIDILLLLPTPPDGAAQEAIERFIGALWDIGLEIGHSVRTVEQCCDEATKDVTVQTTLLEARFVAGQRKLFGRFYDAVHANFDRGAFFKAKRLEQDQRHAKYQETPYSLEPNLKESPGGLRDLQVILWIARASGIGHSWRDLAAHGLVTAVEARQLKRVESFLQEARIRLHYLAGRREDRILFDFQNALAAEFGFVATAARRASELLMQRYFRTAKTVTQLNTILLQNIGATIFPLHGTEAVPLNSRFQAVRELLDAREPDLFDREPGAILESFLLLQQHPELKGMTAPTLRALWRARMHINAAFRRDPANRRRFIELFQQPRGIVHELRRMNQYSILGRYLPAFGKIVGQMQHDLFHVYTVDQHILTVVRNLRRFTMTEFAHEYPLCSQLIANFDRHWLLYIAALFHDIAKGRNGDHSQLGRVDARQFCRAHGFPREDADLVEFLVAHHLTMSSVAQKRDLSDPDVIRSFAAQVGTERRLVALYLLTVADIRGTSPKVWNAWKANLLESLFRATRRLLHGDASAVGDNIEAKQTEALRLLRFYALDNEVKDALWRELDIAYFMRHEPQEIAWQARMIRRRVNSDKAIVKARLAPHGDGLQVMIYTRDRKDLFAAICGYFQSISTTIFEAKIYTTRHGYALDTFLVLGTDRSMHYREMIALIEHDLAERIDAAAAMPPPARGRVSRQLRHFPIEPSVEIRPDEKGQYHMLSIVAGDRPGLLYAIALVLGRYDVALRTAKINTLGERAEDVFVVSGAALASAKTVLALEQDMLAALQPPAA